MRALWRSTESRGEFLEKPGKTEIFLSPFRDTLTGREAPPLLALRRITDHHLEALRAGKTGTAGALTGPAAGSYHTVAHGSFCPLLRCGHFGARRVGAFQNCN